MSKTILIAAGGTGGHLYPALAVADEVRKQRPDVRVIFVGTQERIEAREVPRAGYQFYPIAIEAPRKSLTSMSLFPLKFSKAIVDCMKLISKERPRAMLGAGAYLSVPAGIASWSFRVPIALLEINSVPGAANRWLGRIAQKLFLAYPEATNGFPKSLAETATVCGTPVRAGLGDIAISAEEARASFGLEASRTTILVFGGSLGARAINEAMQASVTKFAEAGYNVLWQTGKSVNLTELQQQFAAMPNVRVTDYIYEMERAYRAADLVVCRAGASSLAEVTRLGKPAVLVPWSGAMANHQEHNARSFEQDGAAVVLRDNEVREKLASTVLELLSDRDRLQKMSNAMKARAHEDAATVVAAWLLDRL